VVTGQAKAVGGSVLKWDVGPGLAPAKAPLRGGPTVDLGHHAGRIRPGGSGTTRLGGRNQKNFSVSSVPLKPQHREHGGSQGSLCLVFRGTENTEKKSSQNNNVP